MPGATLTLDNNVPVPSSPSALGGPVKQTFGYDELYRLTTANGDYEYSSGKHFRYTLNMQYDNIHNIVRKEQTSTNESAGKVQTRTEGTYSWDYAYDGKQPHAPTHIGERTFSYDANGNQTGWTHDNKGARRAIEWDDENRIMVVKDAGSTLDFVYDESGTRLVKRGQYGKTVYVNKFYVVTNGSTVSKHIYAGTTRLATQLVTGEQADKVRTGGGQTTTYSTTTATTTSTGGTATVDTGTTTASSTTGQGSATVDTQATTTATADVATQTGNGKDGKGNNKQARTTASVANTNSNKPETNPGQGLLHRSDRANAVSQNTVKNKNLGGDPKADNTNSGGSNGGSNGNGGSNSNGGGRTSGDNAAMLKQKNQVSYRL